VADTAAPIRDARGRIFGVIVVFRDMTSERELEKAKDEFVSLTSHQLRTPLTAIRLFSEMLSEQKAGELSARQRQYAENIQVSTERMIKLVSEILNVSRIELGELTINPQSTDLVPLVKSYVDELKPVAAKERVRLVFIAPKFQYNHVPIDRSLLGQVIHNLLTNAIRYTPPKGKVTVKLEKTSRGYVIGVTDNGIGIPKDSQGRIFERFYRAENAVEISGEGTGLGLYLAKIVMKSSGGNVSFKSSEGKGTSFYVTIPLRGMKPKVGSKSLNKVE
jgi:two-component system phosphate regulon sensor histidine kinase PhoR